MSADDARTLRRLAGVDAYLVDLIVEGRFGPGARIVDLGAGGGRNLSWFLTSDADYEVHAVEPNPEGLAAFAERRAQLGVELAPERIHACTIEECSLPAQSFDLVILNAVLHFARDEEHFRALFRRSFELVAPGGVFFARLASTVGLEDVLGASGPGWYALPDESERFLADGALVRSETEAVGAEWVRPFKSTVVDRLRTMSTWVLARPV